MTEIIKVRCNGPGKHVNEVDLGQALLEVPIAKQAGLTQPPIPERIVLNCGSCTNGKVVLTRSVIEDARKRLRS
jgi:hypothetical protein